MIERSGAGQAGEAVKSHNDFLEKRFEGDKATLPSARMRA
jgi:hypothetical protein